MSNDGSRVLRQHLSLPHPYIAPRDAIEEGLVEIWRAALNIDAVGVEDDFIDLGGDSPDAEVIATMSEEKFGTHVSLSTLANTPTVATLARAIERLQSSLKR